MDSVCILIELTLNQLQLKLNASAPLVVNTTENKLRQQAK